MIGGNLRYLVIKLTAQLGGIFLFKKTCKTLLATLQQSFFVIKLHLREMKNLSRILTVLVCFAPVAYASAAPVATTAGSNLTAFNPSNANNNQWATMSNGRYDTNVSAKADFGNCNALILRCAQPKCSNGGCAEAGIASAIVKGCVQSNSSCRQYGDDLVQYMTAQLVANSNAKINEQNLAAQQAAAAAAQQQSEQQMQQMQYQMQQMQQQMAQQQAESQQQLQAALAEQAAQNAAALESMKNAATDAAKETEAGISAYQQEAIDRGVSADVLERQTITGQIMTEIENAETSLKEVKIAMNNAFEYAKCDARGNSCSGPKRVKKWRELAHDFTDPYNNTIDKIYDALVVAQTVGVDLSQIYMMLNNSCNSWGLYLCPQMKGGQVNYPNVSATSKGIPQVCPKGTIGGFELDNEKYLECIKKETKSTTTKEQLEDITRNCKALNTIYQTASGAGCQPCTMIKVLTDSTGDKEALNEAWVDAENSTDTGNVRVVACASGVLDSANLFARRTRNKNGTNLVDMDMLELWLDQIGPDKEYGNIKPMAYCYTDVSMKETLRKSTLSKSVDTNKMYCDMNNNGACSTVRANSANASYINPVYAICDAHQYNAGISSNANLKAEDVAEIKEIVGLKTTVISQQMYKQYEYLNATLRRFKIQLEKAALVTKLETAGAKSEEDSSSSSGLLGSNSNNDDKTIFLAGANNCMNFLDFDSAYNCLQTNVSLIIANASGSNYKKACQQLQVTLRDAESILQKKTGEKINGCENITSGVSKSCSAKQKTDVTTCAQGINIAVMAEKRNQSQQSKKIGQQP